MTEAQRAEIAGQYERWVVTQSTEAMEALLASFEGFVYTTARRIHAFVVFDVEELEQIFRAKVWRSIVKYNPERSTRGLASFVSGCVMNEKKDLLRWKQTRDESSIEGIIDRGTRGPLEPGQRNDNNQGRFELRFGLIEDDPYAAVEHVPPLLPNTLSALERQVVVHLYAGRKEHEIAREFGLGRARMEALMDRLKDKLADWRPVAPVPAADDYVEAA